ncbi:DegT/DnrJ/EryC1/StrS family aminotransferase [Vampirovibrio chlorellavorus]|uniref:DegT/DnrJ/EryC1/StrS family aminotransferase n=1 Tax=Vampirovibrio chlorellavorus TaxID=758823 RepID=UPI0026ED5273|nr:DegT/DnrJ/EryC1/StrS family aminotransferase [Vampirovibrio chlorellavorus]
MAVKTSIPLVNLQRQAQTYRDAFQASFTDLLDRADFIGGAAVTQFEQAFAQYCGAQHCVGVGNGTDALYLIFRALGLQPGDEVITCTMSFIATAEIFAPLGVKVVFADIDPLTYTLDVAQVARLITDKTKALLPVHLYGQPADLAALQQLAHQHGLFLIEDAAQAHGAEFAGQRIGSWGQAAAFSFYPGKNLGAFGDGGGITTNDADLAHKIRMLANHGRLSKYEHAVEGVNSRLDTVQASVLLTKLGHLDAWNARRNEIAAFYNAALSDLPDLTLPRVGANRTHVYHLYVVQTAQRDALLQFLNARGIQAAIHYPIPLHLQPAFAHLGYQAGAFPNAETLSQQCLSLPICPELRMAEAEAVVQAVKAFFESRP